MPSWPARSPGKYSNAFTSRNHLVNDLLGNVAPVLLNFTDLSTGSSPFTLFISDLAAEFEQQLNIAYAQPYVLGI